MIGKIKQYKRFIPEFIWEYFRLKAILKSHKRVAKYWDEVIDDYDKGLIEKYEIKPKIVIPNSEKIIWQYWGQGTSSEVVPELIQLCFDSVDRFCGEYQVIRICDETLSEYIDIPDFILDKYHNGVMGATHFTDLVRVSLLSAYGGVWLDATILLTASLWNQLDGGSWFAYQRDDNQVDKRLWRRTYAYYFGWHKDFRVRMLSSVIFAQKGARVMNDWANLLIYYWKTQDSIIDYFFFQIMMNQYLQRYPERNCHIVSDCLPNMLQCYFTGSYTKYSVKEILEKCSIHKLSYKTMTVEQLKLLNLDCNINYDIHNSSCI